MSTYAHKRDIMVYLVGIVDAGHAIGQHCSSIMDRVCIRHGSGDRSARCIDNVMPPVAKLIPVSTSPGSRQLVREHMLGLYKQREINEVF